jgi:aminoglycoside phosphotransferase (APT) family kinase protein
VGDRAGVIYERISGPSLLTDLVDHPAHLRRIMRALAETHADLHQRTVANLPRVREMLAQRATSVAELTEAQRRAVLHALEALPDADTLCHGDYHPDNVLRSPRGPLVIDWENAALGDPLADVARTLLLFRAHFGHSQSAVTRALKRGALQYLAGLYLRRYRQLRPFEMARLRAWELPVTAARLSEWVEPEEAYLWERVRRLTAR